MNAQSPRHGTTSVAKSLTEEDNLPQGPLPSSASVCGLSARQMQILTMLQAGKVNKEIANDLGIGLGTVKQHVVALFKKLNVHNRTMAVSRGVDRPSMVDAKLMAEALLEQRPCVVLSFVLAETTTSNFGEKLGRLLHQVMAASAYDYDAIFIARKDHAGDLVFGIHHASENLVVLALSAAHKIIESLLDRGTFTVLNGGLTALDRGTFTVLKGGLTAGLAIASMNRQGGWSGEAIASAAIAHARALAQKAGMGQLVLGDPARDLLQALGPGTSSLVAETLEFAQLGRLPWQTDTTGLTAPPLVGRVTQQRQLADFLRAVRQGSGRCVYIEGETGMGKSQLCHDIATRCIDTGMQTYHWVCMANLGAQAIFALSDGLPTTLPSLLASLARSTVGPELWIFDDCHLLPHDDLIQIMQQARQAMSKLVLFSGRRLPDAAVHVHAVLQLGRLPASDIQQIVSHYLVDMQTPAKVAALVAQSSGVPLFAVELSRHPVDKVLPLSLRLVVAARMDRLNLDRLLLRHVARDPALWNIKQLSKSLGETKVAVQAALAHAVASGVLVCDDQERFGFNHPLLRQAVIQAEVE